MSRLPSLVDINDARRMIAGSAIRTPLVRLNVREAPAEIYLKLENLQPIGSFKIRGATNAMGHIAPETLSRGVLTASAGNMAQGVAWCARELGIPCTVVAPETAPETKIKAIERLGGRVIKVKFEEWWKAFETRTFPGVEATFIHAFDDLNVMAGNGTIALEIIEDLPEVDAIVGPMGRRWTDLRDRCRDARSEFEVQDICSGSGDGGATLCIAGSRITTDCGLQTIFRGRDRRQGRFSANARARTTVDRWRPGGRIGRGCICTTTDG